MLKWMIRATRKDGAVSHYERTFATEAHSEMWLDLTRARLGCGVTVDLIPATDSPENSMSWHQFAPPPKRPQQPRIKMEEHVKDTERDRWPSAREAWFVVDSRGVPYPLSGGYHKHGSIWAFLEQGCFMDLPGGHDWWRWFRRRGFSLRKFKLIGLGEDE